MPTLLYISTSPRGDYSISRQLGNAAVDAWKARNPQGRVIERDLARTPLTFIDLDWIAGAFSPPEHRNENHKRAIALSDELVAEVVAADEIIVATPMYNFAVPAALKAWIDQVVRVGKTVLFTPSGPQGILKEKKVYVVTSRGGAYRLGTPTERFDYQEPYLRHILAFIGLTDVTFIHVENQKPGEQAEIAKAAAIAQIQELASEGALSAVQSW